MRRPPKLFNHKTKRDFTTNEKLLVHTTIFDSTSFSQLNGRKNASSICVRSPGPTVYCAESRQIPNYLQIPLLSTSDIHEIFEYYRDVTQASACCSKILGEDLKKE